MPYAEQPRFVEGDRLSDVARERLALAAMLVGDSYGDDAYWQRWDSQQECREYHHELHTKLKAGEAIGRDDLLLLLEAAEKSNLFSGDNTVTELRLAVAQLFPEPSAAE